MKFRKLWQILGFLKDPLLTFVKRGAGMELPDVDDCEALVSPVQIAKNPIPGAGKRGFEYPPQLTSDHDRTGIRKFS